MTETSEFPAFMERLIRRWGERVGEADTYDLGELVAFRDHVERAIDNAIAIGRSGSTPWTWTDIGDALGVSKQYAQKRWGPIAAAIASAPEQEVVAGG